MRCSELTREGNAAEKPTLLHHEACLVGSLVKGCTPVRINKKGIRWPQDRVAGRGFFCGLWCVGCLSAGLCGFKPGLRMIPRMSGGTRTASTSPASTANAGSDSATEGVVIVGGNKIEYRAVVRHAYGGIIEFPGREAGVTASCWRTWMKSGQRNQKMPRRRRACIIRRTSKGCGGGAAGYVSLQRRAGVLDPVAAHGVVGPRRVVTTDTQHDAGAPYKIVNNDYSLLDMSDLVFMSICTGTGFSRVFGKDKDSHFWSVDAGRRAFDRFNRRLLTKYSRWNSPK